MSEPPRAPFPVVFADEHVLAVEKPPGRLVIPGRVREAGPAAPTIKDELEAAGFGPLWVVHRLDRGTSGVLVFARNAAAHRTLSRAFEGRDVEKTYWALVAGALYGHGEIDRPLVPARGGGVRVLGPGEAHPEAKPSRTAWRAVERFVASGGLAATAVEARPRTGRLHQIRAHLASLGHPLLVDPPYGGAASVSLTTDHGELVLARTPLHAKTLSLRHPVSGAPLTLAAPLPADLAALVAALRRAS